MDAADSITRDHAPNCDSYDFDPEKQLGPDKPCSCGACPTDARTTASTLTRDKPPVVSGFTIDARTTWDIDDAIWVTERPEGFVVDVSIADVARAVPVGSELANEAAERVETQYFGTGNSPMLPRHLSEDALSLWPNKKRATMTVRIMLAPDLTVVSVNVFLSTLRSSGRLVYDEIPKLLAADPAQDGASGASASYAALRAAKKLADGLLAKRRSRGAMVLYDLSQGWVTTEEGHLRVLAKREDTVGYIIVQELMVLANAAVAEWAMQKGVPILFRNHEGRETGPDREALLKQIEDALHTPLADLSFLRQKTHTLLECAKYEGSPKGHYGLNLPAYTHFTSPIRRYADLVTHHQIRAFLTRDRDELSSPRGCDREPRGDRQLPYSASDLEHIGVTIGTKLEAIQEARSAAAKDKHSRSADRNIELRRLDGLLPKDFERATKNQVRSGQDADPNFVEGFLQRLARADMPLICAALVLAQAPDLENWIALKHAIIRELGPRPEISVSLHALAKQGLGWPDLAYAVSEVGPDHARTFIAIARLLFPEPIQGPELSAATAKRARQLAATALLAKLVGAPVPEFAVLEAPPKPAPVTPKSPSFDFAKQPISALLEWCQATKTPAPEFTFTQSGPPHMPTIVCTLTVAGITKVGTAQSKQDAKALAAAAAIGTLSPKCDRDELSSPPGA